MTITMPLPRHLLAFVVCFCLVSFGKGFQFHRRRPTLRMIRRSIFCAASTTAQPALLHATKQQSSSSLSSSSSSSSNNNNNNNNNNNAKTKTKAKPKTKGVYIRPSGAIERGSGFFVPGLEGPRVRLVVGIVLLLLTVLNHVLIPSSDSDQGMSLLSPSSLEEGLAVSYSLLILFQSAIEYSKEIMRMKEETTSNDGSQSFSKSSTSSSSDNNVVLPQQWSSAINDDGDDADYYRRNKVQWAAASFLAMTPATAVLLLSAAPSDDATPQIVYQLGGTPQRISRVDDQGSTVVAQQQEAEGIQAALDQIRRSKGGRISLPSTHPAVEALVPCLTTSSSSSSTAPSPPRTVILQRCGDHSCWMVASDQLLPSFTPGDLKWLGQLAEYVALEK